MKIKRYKKIRKVSHEGGGLRRRVAADRPHAQPSSDRLSASALGLEAVRASVCSMALCSQWSLLHCTVPLPQILHSYQITHNIKAPFKVAGACDGRATVTTPDDAAAEEATMGGTARYVGRATKHAVLTCLTL